jgi:alpha-galactosidase
MIRRLKIRAWRHHAAGRVIRSAALRAALALALPAAPVAALALAPPALALGNGQASAPPMGWNDWNAYACNVSEQLVEQTALAMHNDGMQAAGYQYVNIGDC